MSIIKNELPILEFDTEKTAVLMPNRHGIDLKLPAKAVFAFLGETVENYAKSHNAKLLFEYETITRYYPIYEFEYKGESVCLCPAPLGSSAATQLLDFLIAYGVNKIVSAGFCGALVDIPENTFGIPYRALRDEGTSYHYMKPSRYVDINRDAILAIEGALKEHNFKYLELMTWTTDGFYRETKELVEYRVQEGCKVVEMECAALAACANMRNVVFGQILYTADSLANIESHEDRDWGKASWEYALKLCLDAVIRL